MNLDNLSSSTPYMKLSKNLVKSVFCYSQMAYAAFRILFCIILLSSVITLDSAHALDQFIYHGFRNAKLHLDGTAKVQPNGLLQLTNTSQQQMGHAFYNIPLKFRANSSVRSESLSFSTSFVFAMVPYMRGLGGQGLAFVISPSMDFSHATANDYLGLFNTSNINSPSNHVLAVEFDTILNPDFKDIDANHVGIDVNSLISNVSASVTYLSSNGSKNNTLKLISGNRIQVWIDYDEEDMLINVTVAPLSIPKPEKPLLSERINLTSIFLDSMYVGFSAATCAVPSFHYLLGWSFNKTGKAQNFDIKNLPSYPGGKFGKKIGLVAIALIVLAGLTSIALITYGYIVWRKKYEEELEDWEKQYNPQRFSFKDLYKATRGFKDKELLGEGGFGRVYRGVLPSSNEEIAVKRISHESKQGIREFIAEIVCMGRLRHRNLVQLLGYCRRRGELLLVYEYMPHGSLDKFLFSEKSSLSWSKRFQVIRGVASALVYLHEEWEQVVLHRDIKASNVLLDADLNGRLGDFGLARLYDHGSNPQTTHLVGTVGYLAPELTRYGKATTGTDVYAFGSFMLEVACGRRPIEAKKNPEEAILVDWVMECWKNGAITDAADPKLQGNFVSKEMEMVLKLGLFCSQFLPAERPSMREVMQYLNGAADFPDIQIQRVGSGAYSSRKGETTSEFTMSFPSSFGKASADSSNISLDSILTSGR